MREYDDWHWKLLRSGKIETAISVGISRCFVGNSTIAIKRKRTQKITVKTPLIWECYLCQCETSYTLLVSNK